MQNSIHAGLRYGFSTHSQTLNSYKEKTVELYKRFDFVSECMNYQYCSKPGVIMKMFYANL